MTVLVSGVLGLELPEIDEGLEFGSRLENPDDPGGGEPGGGGVEVGAGGGVPLPELDDELELEPKSELDRGGGGEVSLASNGSGSASVANAPILTPAANSCIDLQRITGSLITVPAMLLDFSNCYIIAERPCVARPMIRRFSAMAMIASRIEM